MACAGPCCSAQFFASPHAPPRPRTPGPRAVVPYGPPPGPGGLPVVVPVRPTRAEVEMASQMRAMGYQMQAYGDAMRASSVAAEAANRQMAQRTVTPYPPWPQYGPPMPVAVPVAVPVPLPYYPPPCNPYPPPPQGPYPPPPPPPYPRGRPPTPGPRYPRQGPPQNYDPPHQRPPSRHGSSSYQRGSFYPFTSHPPPRGYSRTHSQPIEIVDDPRPPSRRTEPIPRRPKQPRHPGGFYPDHNRISYTEMPRLEPNHVKRRTFHEEMADYEDGVVHLDCSVRRPRSRSRSRVGGSRVGSRVRVRSRSREGEVGGMYEYGYEGEGERYGGERYEGEGYDVEEDDRRGRAYWEYESGDNRDKVKIYIRSESRQRSRSRPRSRQRSRSRPRSRY